jgi:hypothetical protein
VERLAKSFSARPWQHNDRQEPGVGNSFLPVESHALPQPRYAKRTMKQVAEGAKKRRATREQ